MDFLPNTHFGNVNLFGWLGLSPMSGSDLESNESGKELAVVVDVMILMTHKNQEILYMSSHSKGKTFAVFVDFC